MLAYVREGPILKRPPGLVGPGPGLKFHIFLHRKIHCNENIDQNSLTIFDEILGRRPGPIMEGPILYRPPGGHPYGPGGSYKFLSDRANFKYVGTP